MSSPCFIILGVSGAGKSTISQHLAKKLSLPFFDADDFHPEENIKKMENSIPLLDEDRLPWLQAINSLLQEHQDIGFVLACSALKESYRKILSQKLRNITWIYLSGDYELIKKRIESRKDHFMSAALLKNQFETLEIPNYGFKVSIEYSPAEIVQQIIDHLSD